MTPNQAKLYIGKVGEDIVNEAIIFTEKTPDWFDAKKDGRIGYLTYEVKTLRINHRDQGFWMPENQWKKLDGVDLFFIVKVPEEVEEGLRLYQMVNHHKNYTIVHHGSKRFRNYLFTKCMPYDIITDDRVKSVMEASQSLQTWKKK